MPGTNSITNRDKKIPPALKKHGKKEKWCRSLRSVTNLAYFQYFAWKQDKLGQRLNGHFQDRVFIQEGFQFFAYSRYDELHYIRFFLDLPLIFLANKRIVGFHHQESYSNYRLRFAVLMEEINIGLISSHTLMICNAKTFDFSCNMPTMERLSPLVIHDSLLPIHFQKKPSCAKWVNSEEWIANS